MKPKFEEFNCNSSIEGIVYSQVEYDYLPYFEYMRNHPSFSWIQLVMDNELDGINSRMLQL